MRGMRANCCGLIAGRLATIGVTVSLARVNSGPTAGPTPVFRLNFRQVDGVGGFARELKSTKSYEDDYIIPRVTFGQGLIRRD
jgi:hypothetical protein